MPAPVRHQLRALWVGQRRMLATAQASERTLCHLDVWPANLILDCFADGLMDVALLPEVSESVTDGYLAGLRDGGWAGKADAVRMAIAARSSTAGSPRRSFAARCATTPGRPPTGPPPRPRPWSSG
jgi:hypothetical protein